MLERNFISELLETFRRCEDLEDLDSLRHIYKIVKGIFAMCNAGLFEQLFEAAHILDVIGMFECVTAAFNYPACILFSI